MTETEKAYQGEDANLESLRAQIDECDKDIIKLLARRFELVQKIGIYKAIHDQPVLDEAREVELLSDRKQQASVSGNYSVKDIFELILEESRQIQMKVRKNLGSDRAD